MHSRFYSTKSPCRITSTASVATSIHFPNAEEQATQRECWRSTRNVLGHAYLSVIRRGPHHKQTLGAPDSIERDSEHCRRDRAGFCARFPRVRGRSTRSGRFWCTSSRFPRTERAQRAPMLLRRPGYPLSLSFGASEPSYVG